MSSLAPAAPGHPEALILVQEISHRVVNEYTQAIAAIRLAAADVTSMEARAALIRAAARLRSFADAHRALQAPGAGSRVDLGEYLGQVCAALVTAGLGDRGVRLTLVTAPICLRAERGWRVALIVSELIANAARHGFRGGPGIILVEIEEADGGVTCRVGDNGRAAPNPTPSGGMAVAHGLAAELDGGIKWCFTTAGATVELTFPREAMGRTA